jgi:plastocyanin
VTSRHRPRALGSVVALVVAAALLGACGGGGGGGAGYTEPAGPALQTVTIQAGNLFFKPDKVTLAKPGIYELRLENTQSGSHTLVFGDKVKGFRLDVTGSGSFNQKKIELQKGTYTFWCDVPGHRAAGMEGTITVK